MRNIIFKIVKYFGRYLIDDLVRTQNNDSNSIKPTYTKYCELTYPEYTVLKEMEVQSVKLEI